MLLFGDIAQEYADFAGYCQGDSPTFVEWANRVTTDDDVIAWLAGLPPIKRQPNLVFAAARFHGVPAPGSYAGLRAALLGDDGTIVRRSSRAPRRRTRSVGSRRCCRHSA